jgi:hypothetical protein
MDKRQDDRKKSMPLLKKRTLAIIIAVLVLLVALVGFFVMQPQRTVANFCKSAKDEKSNFKANTSYDKLLGSFKKLDTVAPEDIHPDTSLIVKGYESIVSDPSKAISSEAGISSSQMRVNDYIIENCPDY